MFIKKKVKGTQSHCSDNPCFFKEKRSKICMQFKKIQSAKRYIMKCKSLLIPVVQLLFSGES